MSARSRVQAPQPASTPVRAGASRAPARLQRSSKSPETVPVPASVRSALDSPGRPLDGETRADMEGRFGRDLGAVRIHDGPSAARSADDVGARAYTVGQDIVFGEGSYAPGTREGRSLLAHELTHTVQQGGLQRSARDGVASERAPGHEHLEREAEATARAIDGGGQAGTISRAEAPVLSRQKKKGAASKPASPKGVATAQEVDITHDVAHFATLTHKVKREDSGKKSKLPRVRVDKFYLPGTKGEGAQERYKEHATANQLRAVVGFNDSGAPRSELWQARDRTEVLGESWLQRVGWPVDEKDARWQAITGKNDPFPIAKGKTANIDHIIELQLGGTNNPANLRPLDADPNQESGRTIWLEVSGLAKALREDGTLGLGGADEIELVFTDVESSGVLERHSPITKDPTALMVGVKAESERVAPTDDATTKYIDLAAGASRDTFAVPATWSKSAPLADLEANPFNKGPAQFISSMLVKRLRYTGPSAMVAEAELDLRNRTRIPLGAKAAAGGKAQLFKLAGKKQGAGFALSLTDKPAVVEFDYPFLSRVRMTRIELNPSGDLDWQATVTPSIRFLPEIRVEYSLGQLRVISGLDEDKLKKKELLGFRVTRAQVTMALAPVFDVNGELAFAMGDPASPLVVGNLKLSKDDIGVVGQGRIDVRLPKVKEAGSDITYKGGAGRNEWTFALQVRSEDFTLPGGYTLSGALDAKVQKGELEFVGKLAATLPGDGTAELELERSGAKRWVLAGRASLQVPRLDRVTAWARYDLASRRLVASTKDVRFELFGIAAKLNELTGEFEPEKRPVFHGAGEIELNKGKVAGKAQVQLGRNGKWTGKGSVTYRFNDKLSATAGVELDEKERLKFSGKLVLTYLKLFDEFGDEKELFKFTLSIPIPGASIGGVGLEARVGAGAKAKYSIGPGSLGPVIFTADFYPLEENSDLVLTVEGNASIPAMARLTAEIEGGIALDAFVAEVGGKVVLEGWIELKGGLFAKFEAKYTKGSLEAKLTPEIMAKLMLGLALKINAWAKAGIGWLSVKTEKTWELGRREVDTGLGFSLKAPLEYSSERGPKFPTVDQVELRKPEITSGTMERILDQLVHGTRPSEREV